jgi:RNA polymerase sigma factor (sigma-70 family)
MGDGNTNASIQQYLDDLAAAQGSSWAEPVVRDLLARAVRRLHMVSANMLHRRYARLKAPPLNLQTEELLSAVVERLLKALETVRPQNVREFFAVANQHMRWELNDLARRLDQQTPDIELRGELDAAPDSSVSELSRDARRMLEAIDNLPDDEREAFGLVRIQGMTKAEAAEILGVSTKTIQRRVSRSLLLLSERLDDLRPNDLLPGGA